MNIFSRIIKYSNFVASKVLGVMKKYSKIAVLLSFLAFCFTASVSIIDNGSSHNVFSALSLEKNISYVHSSLPNNNLFNIRHRSALQNEDVSVGHPEELIYTYTYLSESTPEYYSKWNTYFYTVVDILPQQVFLPVFGLRAPPFAC